MIYDMGEPLQSFKDFKGMGKIHQIQVPGVVFTGLQQEEWSRYHVGIVEFMKVFGTGIPGKRDMGRQLVLGSEGVLT